MNGYGLYVWMSFSIVLISCAFVYIKTKKTLKKYEQEFLKELQTLTLEEKNRAEGDQKMVFTHTLEFDGILSSSSYPFCAGNGVPCEPDSAIPIPFGYKLVGVGFVRQSSEISVDINFSVEHYGTDSALQVLSNFSVTGATKSSLYTVAPVLCQKGFITVKVGGVSGVTGYGRYRIALYLQSDQRFI